MLPYHLDVSILLLHQTLAFGIWRKPPIIRLADGFRLIHRVLSPPKSTIDTSKSAASVPDFSPGSFSAQGHSTSELLRTL